MFLKDAIKGLIAGIGVCLLVPAVAALGILQPVLAGEKNGDRLSGKPAVLSLETGGQAKSRQAKRITDQAKRITDNADDFLREEFGDSAIKVEPAAAESRRSLEPVEEVAAPLHGYGNFEGVVLVAPADGGLVLVEPAAETKSAEAVPVDADSEGTARDDEAGDEIEVPEDLSGTQDDPWESVNRMFFEVNEVLDHLIVAPAARVYHVVVPEPLRLGISNAVRNVRSPVILANDILQGNRQGASDTIVRFMVNSTIGLGGLIDAAGYMGVQRHSEDFGQTLAVWGVGSGPYMVVPVLGPSNPRDLAGLAVDAAFNPLTWILFDEPFEVRFAPSAIELVVGRESILDDFASLRATSPDLYASVRDIYLEKRQTEIANGDITGEPIPGVTSLPGTSVMTPVKPF